jgi:P-type E1-E2 ATPase
LVGTAAGARRGLLIRGGDILEATSSVNVVVFDKTGTLTAGKPVVTSVKTIQDPDGAHPTNNIACHSLAMDASRLLKLAAIVEANTTHPVARVRTGY